MAKVSMKSTKQEILEVVSELEAELKAARASKVTVADTQVAKVKEERMSNAKKVMDMGILNPDIVKQFDDVSFAIEVAKEQLAEIQGVKDAIIDAEAVIMAKDAIIAERDAKEVARIAELKEESIKIIAEREEKVAALELLYKEKSLALEKERKREAEEFAYNLKRSRQLENDKWEDEKAAREKEITDRENAVESREIYISDVEYKFDELEAKVAEIPTLIEAAKAEAYESAKKAFDKEKAIEVNSTKKNAEWEIKMANMEKDRAIDDLAKAQDKIAALEAKLEAAYTSMNALATTTVQSTGGVKILETGKDK